MCHQEHVMAAVNGQSPEKQCSPQSNCWKEPIKICSWSKSWSLLIMGGAAADNFSFLDNCLGNGDNYRQIIVFVRTGRFHAGPKLTFFAMAQIPTIVYLLSADFLRMCSICVANEAVGKLNFRRISCWYLRFCGNSICILICGVCNSIAKIGIVLAAS